MRHNLTDSENEKYFDFFDAYAPTNVCFGEGGASQLGEQLLGDKESFAFLVLGGENSSMKSGAYNQFIQMALAFDLEVPVFRGVSPEPDVDTVRAIVAELEKNKPGTMIAIGGGSVLDAAKAAYLSWQTGMDVTELFGVNKASEAFPGKEFRRVICMPTTSGTGSEVTPYSNIVDPEAGTKRIIVEEQIIPALALVDPSYTLSLPCDLTVATAFDAMTHAIESLLNTKAKGADPDAEKWAVEAIKLIVEALPLAVKYPGNYKLREMLSAASTLAGMCIKNRPTGLPHLCSYSFYGKVPHGIAVAALLPCFWRYYLESAPVKKATMKLRGIFRSLDPQETAEDVINAYEGFFKQMTEINGLRDLDGFDKTMITKIAASAKDNPVKLETAPRPIKPADAEKVLTEILTDAL